MSYAYVFIKLRSTCKLKKNKSENIQKKNKIQFAYQQLPDSLSEVKMLEAILDEFLVCRFTSPKLDIYK